MKLTENHKRVFNESVLCWLATSSMDNVPNVSPKEIFSYYGANELIIANIASPQSVKNIKQNHHVCVSLINILTQKGFKIYGNATIIKKSDPAFKEREKVLLKKTKGKFPFVTIIKINIEQITTIIAPKYVLYPETTEEEQIKSAKKTYGF